jgi:hypothetical protein
MALFNRTKRSIFGYDIFISYSRKDSLDYAYAIAQYFIDKGYECYIDQLANVQPGRKLPEKIINVLKYSKALVLIGSEGAHESIAIESEIQHFLANHKDNPIIPITIEGTINANAIWFEKIVGLALVEETRENFNNSTPSDDVLTRIENALQFKKKGKRLRQIALGVVVAALVLIIVIVWQVHETQKEAVRSQVNSLHARANDDYGKMNYPDALDQLIAIEKIDDDKKEALRFFEEGIHTCMEKDSFPRGLDYLAKTNQLFSKVFPNQFEGIHCNFLLNEVRSLLKGYNIISSSLKDSIHDIIGCILNKVHSYPGYADSVNSFFKNEYYLPISTWTYVHSEDLYNYKGPSFSNDQELIALDGLDSVHILSLRGENKYTVAKTKRYIDLGVYFFPTDKNKVLVYYPSENFYDDSTQHAIIYSKGDSIQKINKAKVTLIPDAIYSTLQGPPGYQRETYLVDHIQLDTVYLKKIDYYTEIGWAPFFRDSLNRKKLAITSKDNTRILYTNSDSLVVLDSNYNKLQLITLGYTDPGYDYIRHPINSSLLFLIHRNQDRFEKGTYLFDDQLNYKAFLRHCENPFLLLNGNYILDLGSQTLWCTDPKKVFSERNWDAALSKEEKRKYGIEFN